MGMFRTYLKDNNGQFAIMFSLFATVLVIGAIVAVDIARLVNTKTKIAAVTDAAALAGAQAFDQVNRISIVEDFLNSNGGQILPAAFASEPQIHFDDDTGEVSVFVDTTVELPFAKVLGGDNREVGYTSIAVYPNSIDPLTIAFVLDVSGSMGEQTKDGQIKLNVLKQATMELFAEIDSQIRNKESIDRYLRTGMSAFNDVLAAEQAMTWGFVDVESAVDGLVASGKTNSHIALANAHEQIKDDRGFRQTVDPTFNLATLDEFVIFMTDGTNTAGTPEILDEDSYEVCLAMRDDGIAVYAVAFTAPERGQLLLIDCASWDDPVEDRESKRNRNRNRKCGKRRGNSDDGLANAAANNGGFNENAAKALDKCLDEVLDDKKEHFFDADDAQSFTEIFRLIGQKINEASIRIKS